MKKLLLKYLFKNSLKKILIYSYLMGNYSSVVQDHITNKYGWVKDLPDKRDYTFEIKYTNSWNDSYLEIY